MPPRTKEFEAQVREILLFHRAWISIIAPTTNEIDFYTQLKSIYEKTGKPVTTNQLMDVFPEKHQIAISTLAKSLYDKGYLQRTTESHDTGGCYYLYTPYTTNLEEEKC